ncbi:MAG: alpha-L-rhamnosidase-related protein, partial [Promethearchaeota archaeon]
DTVTGLVLGSNTPRVGDFVCNHKLINRLYHNIVWGQRSNFLEIPTDCPQRDERLGWTGDIMVFINTAIYNMDVSAFFKKWLKDLKDTQFSDGAVNNVAPIGPFLLKADAGWGDAIIHCPLKLYYAYEDKTFLSQYYNTMKKWFNYLVKTSKNYLRGFTHCFGDWLSVNANTPNHLIQSAFFAYSANLLYQISTILNKTQDAKYYKIMFNKIKKSFIKKYISSNGKIKCNTQTAYLLALAFNLYPEELKTKGVKYLVDDIKKREIHLSTGFLGTPLLLPVLTEFGYTDLAYQLLLQDTFPSWLFPVKNGATTIWERWDGWTKEKGPADPNMNSFNHYAYGAIGEWLFSYVAGIKPKKPGYKEVLIKPIINKKLKFVNVTYHSISGPIKVSWELRKNILKFSVHIPANTKAEIHVPSTNPKNLKENGKIISKNNFVKIKNIAKNEIVLHTGSGKYNFTTEYRI